MDRRHSGSSVKFIVLYALLFLGTFGGFYILKGLMGTEYPIMVVVSNSMEPTLGVGDYIFVQGVDNASSINAAPDGDIIVFPRPSSYSTEYIVHRAIRKIVRGTSVSFVTKGDHNYASDPWEVSAMSIIGKVYGRAPFLGYFSLFERTSGGIVTLILLICIVLFIDYLLPIKKTEPNIPSPIPTEPPSHLRNLTMGILLVSLLPYPLSFIVRDNQLVPEVLALGCWYACDLLLPAVIVDEDNSLMLWLYHFVLLVLPVSTDVIYHITGIMPRDWWQEPRGSVPLTWFLSGETGYYYNYISILGTMLIPGCLLFFYSLAKERRGKKTP